LFETQFCTPEVEHIPQEDFSILKSNVKNVLQKLHCSAKNSNLKKASLDSKLKKPKFVLLDEENDSDDFVTQLVRELVGKSIQPSCSGNSSDDFVTQTQKVRSKPDQGVVLSNKRPMRVTKKFRKPVPKLDAYKFPHLNKPK
jgi:phosphoribosylaminoimidazole carboxylase (NCAIR synthetase)